MALLRRYCLDYVLLKNLDVCDEIMVPDYAQHIGGRHYRGRDSEYKATVRKAFERFPTLGFTVHRVITDGDTAAMHFTEHGTSAEVGRPAVWSGIGIYGGNGALLTYNWSEQDRWTRRRQLEGEEPLGIKAPGVDPWAVSRRSANERAQRVVRDWLEQADLSAAPESVLDDDWLAPRGRPRLRRPSPRGSTLSSAPGTMWPSTSSR